MPNPWPACWSALEPSDRSVPAQDGDIINIDVTVFLNGFHGDTSRTFLVGNVDPEARKLVAVTEEALARAIAICKPGVPFRQIGTVINDYADSHALGTVKAFVGHGVGRMFHSKPTIMHCRNNEEGVMAAGQTFTIEPMLTLGAVRETCWSDEWTMVTADGSWSAQFEHTLLITPGGCEVLTVTGAGKGAALKPSNASTAAVAAGGAAKPKGFGAKR